MDVATYPSEDVQLLSQVVSDPRFRRLSLPPRVALPEVGLLVGCYAVFTMATWGGIAGWLPYPVVLAISASAIFAIFTPLHDAVHRSVSSIPWLNDLVGNLAAALLIPGVTTQLYRYLHLEHHRYTGERDRDPDEPFISARWPFRLFIWLFVDLYWISFYIRHRHERPRAEQRAFWITVAVALSWYVVWLLSPYAHPFIIYWFIPQRLGLLMVVYLFAFIQHPADIEQRKQPFQATRVIYGGALMRTLLLGQSNHLVHHLFPSIPYYRYHLGWELGQTAFREREIVRQWPLAPPVQPKVLSTPASSERIKVKITAIEHVAESVRAYRLETLGGALPAFEAGAHIDVTIAPRLVRQYSLCSDPADRNAWRIAVRREAAGRGGSKMLHEQFKIGDVIEVGTPRNHFRLRGQDGPAVLIAGGVGITPLIAMAHDLHRRGQRFEFHVCGRSAAALPFFHDLQSLPFADKIQVHLDDGPEDQNFGVRTIPRWQSAGALYVCGPAGFMDMALDYARQRGWPDERVFTERFIAPQADPGQNRAFDVVLRQSGRILSVPADKSLLDVLQSNDVAVPASCTQGLCGACIVRVTEGEVDHRDVVLGDHRESGPDCWMTSCVSRARGDRLVIDL